MGESKKDKRETGIIDLELGQTVKPFEHAMGFLPVDLTQAYEQGVFATMLKSPISFLGISGSVEIVTEDLKDFDKDNPDAIIEYPLGEADVAFSFPNHTGEAVRLPLVTQITFQLKILSNLCGS